MDTRFDVTPTVFKLVHPLNVLSRIEVTPDGIVIDVNDVQSLKAEDPMELTDEGIVGSVSQLMSNVYMFPTRPKQIKRVSRFESFWKSNPRLLRAFHSGGVSATELLEELQMHRYWLRRCLKTEREGDVRVDVFGC